MPTRQRGDDPAQSQLTPTSHSVFAPLERVLGPYFCEDYMFMGVHCEISLYKNIRTRRYLNLDAEGHAWRFESGSYHPQPLADAIMAVFA